MPPPRPGPRVDDGAVGALAPYVAKRGRPTVQQTAAIDRLILVAAADCFLSQGYDVTTMEAIAASAGVSKGTLYSRYPGKDTLLPAVVAHKMAEWSDSASARDRPPSDALVPRLKQHAETVMVWAMSGEFAAMERLFASPLPPAAREAVRALYSDGFDTMIGVFEQAIRDLDRGDPSPVRDPRRVATMLMAMLTGWYRIEPARRGGDEAGAVAFAHQAVDILVLGRAGW